MTAAKQTFLNGCWYTSWNSERQFLVLFLILKSFMLLGHVVSLLLDKILLMPWQRRKSLWYLMELAQTPGKSRTQVLREAQTWDVRISAGGLCPPDPRASQHRSGCVGKTVHLGGNYTTSLSGVSSAHSHRPSCQQGGYPRACDLPTPNVCLQWCSDIRSHLQRMRGLNSIPERDPTRVYYIVM